MSHCLKPPLHQPALTNPRKSSVCQMEAGQSLKGQFSTLPRSSGCSANRTGKALLSCFWIFPQISQSSRTSVFPMSALQRSTVESHGKPEGYFADLTGCGPLLLDHVTLENDEQGGVQIMASYPSILSNHFFRRSGSKRLWFSSSLRMSTSVSSSVQFLSPHASSSQDLISPCRTSPAKK